jgi:hypothetical protein
VLIFFFIEKQKKHISRFSSLIHPPPNEHNSTTRASGGKWIPSIRIQPQRQNNQKNDKKTTRTTTVAGDCQTDIRRRRATNKWKPRRKIPIELRGVIVELWQHVGGIRPPVADCRWSC